MFARILTAFATVVPLLAASPSPAEDPLRFLTIPIAGTIGADCTPNGVRSALALATSGNDRADAVLLEIDALDGAVADGREIARSIREAANVIRTIAVVRRAGGAALPILNACETWVVLESNTTMVDDGEGGREPRHDGLERLVLRTLPRLALDQETMTADLEELRLAILESIPPSLPGRVGDSRRALATALCDPFLDLQSRPSVDAVPALQARDGGDDSGRDLVRTSRQGPGISGTQLHATGMCLIAGEGLEPLAEVLGVDSVESLGDPGVLLVIDAANERFTDRGRVNSRIDAMIGTLDTADSLVSAMPWTLERARLSLPTSPRLRGNYPMTHADGKWTIAPEFRPAWITACGDCLRRWSGVTEVHSSLMSVLERGQNLRRELESLNPGPTTRDRMAAALAVFDRRMIDLEGIPESWTAWIDEADRTISRVETWRETPPTPGD